MLTSTTRLVRRLLAAGAALTLAAGLAGATPAVAGDRGTDGDQPLPGYTISNPPLAPLVVGGVPTTVRQGVHEHAGYIIETPARWNGELVMWAHGYRGQGTELSPEPPAYDLRQRLLGQGYAWASSSYDRNGYDIRSGVLSTRHLADLFADTVRRPHRVYLAGVSMGGHIIGRSLEQYPGYYDGALPMCGVLGDHELFDFFLDYNLVAQALAGVRAYPTPDDYLTNAVPRIQVALGLAGLTPGGPDTTNDLGKQLRAVTVERSGGQRPGADAAFAVWKDFLFGITTTDGGDSPAQRPGQLATNLLTRYSPNSPVNLNATVQRVAPENLRQRLSPTLTEVPRINGRPTVPVLTLHDLGDLFVPFSMEQAYARDAAWHGRSRLVVQRAVRAAQHCEFSPAEAGAAWDDLVSWVRTGKRPAGDAVTDPRAVRAADFGCRFSDRAAWAAGAGTRRLYAAC
ncbi:alpha/beta hydrolase [Micromonospora sp. HK10]|uniref:alpha/beta hydrolase n=1 Tax=Micromonospora sp. HK10 TaxID=1538294 RepID=UPI0006270869|nr:alpha/beta hydrolase [Micromonospora sp. HK10]KKK05709.1 LigA [Micromonospora sp. HK10]